jgi:hypothetical protein
MILTLTIAVAVYTAIGLINGLIQLTKREKPVNVKREPITRTKTA